MNAQLPFPTRIMEAAQEYHWPGNLRELRSFVTRTLILQDEEAAYNDLRAKTRSSLASSTPSGMKGVICDVKNQTEIRMLQDALSASGWNRRKAAINLNISYRSLLYKIQQYRLSA